MAREFSKRFYKSKEWKKTREYIFNKYHGLCAICGKPGQEVHHKEFLSTSNMNDINITLGESNLILLCKDCHHRKHAKKVNARDGLIFNESGELIEIDVVPP